MATNEEPAAEPPAQQGSRRDRVMLGSLPDDFLQLNGEGTSDGVPANYHPAMFGGFQQAGGVLNVTVVQARFAKNYGLTRMDPFCRIRIGVQVFETPTAYNGAKTPRWNKMIQSQIPNGLNEIFVEVYDECTFSIDDRIAWGLVKVKDEVMQGKVVDEWYPLSGKQGDGKEGMIHLIIQYKKRVPPMMMAPVAGGTPMVIQQPFPGYMYGYPPMMYAPQVMPSTQIIQQQQSAEPPISAIGQINEKDLKTLKEMCPEMDDDIIRSVYQQAGGNLDRAAAQLLEIAS